MKELPLYEFVHAWDIYRVGQRIRPTGMLRSVLLAGKLIRKVPEAVAKPQKARRQSNRKTL